jgi:hypothetical protein
LVINGVNGLDGGSSYDGGGTNGPDPTIFGFVPATVFPPSWLVLLLLMISRKFPPVFVTSMDDDMGIIAAGHILCTGEDGGVTPRTVGSGMALPMVALDEDVALSVDSDVAGLTTRGTGKGIGGGGPAAGATGAAIVVF